MNAQSYKSFIPTKGEIVFREISKITDRKSFDGALERSKEKFMESLKKTFLKEEASAGKEHEIDQNVALASEMLETLHFSQGSSRTYHLRFNGLEIGSLILEGEEVFTDNVFVENTYPYSLNVILKIVTDKQSKKTINGYDCYKVTYEYKENDKEGDEDYLQYVKNTIHKREMWVTDKIKSLYHPVIYEKQILEKYYPLDILETQSDIKGFERKFILQNITLE